MSRRKYKQESNPLKMVIYIIAVLALIGCLGYLVYSSREQKKEHAEEVRRIAAKETEFAMTEKERETEPVTETEGVAKNKVTDQISETESEEVKEAASSNTAEKGKDSAVLVLNGTGRPGVAGYWQKQLEEAGYTNVVSASYTGEIDDETIIYAADEKEAEVFKEQFPNADFEKGSIETGIEAAEGSSLPEHSDIYIVVGSNDARSE